MPAQVLDFTRADAAKAKNGSVAAASQTIDRQ
jgi:hypothetical protein